MIQRFIHDALTAALARIKEEPELLDRLFRDELGLEEESELESIRKCFADQPPTVIMGYARGDSPFPLLSVTLGAEGGKEDVLEAGGGQVLDEMDDDYGADIKAQIWTHSYNVFCYTEHPDYTSYLYEVAKATLSLNMFDYFVSKGMFGTNISGTELAPDPKYVPEHLFLRQITVRCDKEFRQIDPKSKLGKAFKVRGISVDKSGSSSDVGGVPTNVKVRTK